MKRRFNIKAISGNHKSTVSVLVETGSDYMRHESETKARNVADAIIRELQAEYRPTRITVK